MRARSTAASVCPGRRSTPFWRARRGLMCPGRPRSQGRVAGSASALSVAARSWIETPVEQSCPSRSTVTVKGVPSSEVLFSSIILSSNWAHRSSDSGAQSTPRPFLSMKLTISGVTFSAATMKSPSFSRSSSSTTMTILPLRKSSSTSSTLLSLTFSVVICSGFMYSVFFVRLCVTSPSVSSICPHTSPHRAAPSRWWPYRSGKWRWASG